jgi:hypothetical protein
LACPGAGCVPVSGGDLGKKGCVQGVVEERFRSHPRRLAEALGVLFELQPLLLSQLEADSGEVTTQVRYAA